MQPMATPITGRACLVTNQSALYILTGFTAPATEDPTLLDRYQKAVRGEPI